MALYIGKRAISTAHAANACSPQKGIDSWTRQDTTSCQCPATSSKRILPTVPDMDHLCGRPRTTKHMICWGKPESTKVVVTKPFWKDGTMMTNTASLCQISGGLRSRSNNMTQLHWKIILTWLQLKKEVGTINPGKFRWTERVCKDQRINALILMKQSTCKRLYDEYTERTGEGNRPIPLLHSKSDSDMNNHSRASMSTSTQLILGQDGDFTLHPDQHLRLHPRTGTRTTTGSRIEVGILGKPHPGLNSFSWHFLV